MKTTRIFLMAALALTFAACSNDDNDILSPEQSQKAAGIPFTATISIGETAATRTLTEDGTTLAASWTVGDKVAMIHNGVKDEMEVESVSEGIATIKGTITGSPSGSDPVTIIYPSDAADGTTGNVKSDWLAAQDGTLKGTGGTSIEEKYDVRKGTGTLNASGTSLSGTVSLANQNAIFKFTLYDFADAAINVDVFVISDNDGNKITTVKPSSAASELYVAMPVLSAGSTYWFNATIIGTYDDKHYIAKKTMGSSATEAGKYYQTPVKMATCGDVILADGSFAVKGTTGEKAIIAYVGEDGQTGYRHGLALALEDANSGNKVKWCNQSDETCLATQYGDISDAYADDIDGIANTAALVAHGSHTHAAASAAKEFTGDRPANTSPWFLPTVAQWAFMSWDAGSYDDLKTKAGMKSDATYWSSTEVDYECAWSSDEDWDNYKDDERYVRACLAF
jgi:hypothetical protein